MFKLCNVHEHAVGLMVALDMRHAVKPDPVCLIELANTAKVSLSYAEHIFAKLQRAGLVKAKRGAGGGYQLQREGTQIMVQDICDAIKPRDPYRPAWTERALTETLYKTATKAVAGVTLAQLSLCITEAQIQGKV